jgi:glyoxylase-like metal-dependent hydrolase (beta-lactamase superfamily II)
MILESLCLGPFGVNCYILASAKNAEAIIIDPGGEEKKIRKVLEKHKLEPAFIINTHGHFDHIGCNDKFSVPVYIHSRDMAFLNDPKLNLSGMLQPCACNIKSEIKSLEDKQKIVLGPIQLQVIHTPGHTPGGICLLLEKPANKILFSGDTLFFQGIGRTDFPGADEGQLKKSIKEQLFKLPEDTVIYPGHGMPSTIGEEKQNNPFIS